MAGHATQLKRLIRGPYHPPPAGVGDELECEVRGSVKVACFGDGPIPWPRAHGSNGGRRNGPYILCGDLVSAVRIESKAAVAFWWGVGKSTVSRWRRQLGVGRFTPGTVRLVSLAHRGVAVRGSVAADRHAMRRRRQALGLSLTAVAKRLGNRSVSPYWKIETGQRPRVTPAKLRRIARALRCAVEDLRGGVRPAGPRL